MNSSIRIIGVPIDLGQAQRGVDMGPAALRFAELAARLTSLGYLVRDGGNIAVPVRDTLENEHHQHSRPSRRDSIPSGGRRAASLRRVLLGHHGRT